MREPTVLLAALEDGTHVQVGRVREHGAAYALWERFDGDLGTIHGRGQRPHYLDGKAVRFYRLRQQGHEFGNVPSYPTSALRFTRDPKGTFNRMTRTTPGGIARPKKGQFTRFETARSVARKRNLAGVGRGHRAIKAQDGWFAVVFRPAVVNNKQRRVREVI